MSHQNRQIAISDSLSRMAASYAPPPEEAARPGMSAEEADALLDSVDAGATPGPSGSTSPAGIGRLSEQEADALLNQVDAGAVPDAQAPEPPMDLKRGVMRGLERQGVGLGQIGSDIGRALGGESGTPYSAYREGLNRRGRELEEESAKAPALERIAEAVPGIIEAAVVPAPVRFVPKIGLNALIGGALGAVEPAESPTERARRAGVGLAAGAGLTAAGRGLSAAVGRAGELLPGGGKRAAIRLLREQGKPFRWGLPRVGPHRQYSILEGIQPTVGMENPNTIYSGMERNARMHLRGAFEARDIANKAIAAKALENRALSESDALGMKGALNEQTRGIRDAALQAARERPAEEMVTPIRSKIEELSTTPGLRDDPSVQKLVKFAGRVAEREDIDPADLYTLRKNLDDMLASGPLDQSKLTNAVKNSRREAMGLKEAIDEGLGPEFQKYLAAYREGITPVKQGEAFRKILESFSTKPHLPGTELPELSPVAYKRAIQRETYKRLGKNLKDILTPEQRETASEIDSLLEDIANAQSAGRAIQGSQTTPLRIASGTIPGYSEKFRLLNDILSIGNRRGESALDASMLDPEAFKSLVELARKAKKAGILKRGIARAGYTPLAQGLEQD